jgi:hypothetical protein
MVLVTWSPFGKAFAAASPAAEAEALPKGGNQNGFADEALFLR